MPRSTSSANLGRFLTFEVISPDDIVIIRCSPFKANIGRRLATTLDLSYSAEWVRSHPHGIPTPGPIFCLREEPAFDLTSRKNSELTCAPISHTAITDGRGTLLLERLSEERAN